MEKKSLGYKGICESGKCYGLFFFLNYVFFGVWEVKRLMFDFYWRWIGLVNSNGEFVFLEFDRKRGVIFL